MSVMSGDERDFVRRTTLKTTALESTPKAVRKTAICFPRPNERVSGPLRLQLALGSSYLGNSGNVCWIPIRESHRGWGSTMRRDLAGLGGTCKFHLTAGKRWVDPRAEESHGSNSKFFPRRPETVCRSPGHQSARGVAARELLPHQGRHRARSSRGNTTQHTTAIARESVNLTCLPGTDAQPHWKWHWVNEPLAFFRLSPPTPTVSEMISIKMEEEE
jgi:hypothetical protein